MSVIFTKNEEISVRWNEKGKNTQLNRGTGCVGINNRM